MAQEGDDAGANWAHLCLLSLPGPVGTFSGGDLLRRLFLVVLGARGSPDASMGLSAGFDGAAAVVLFG
jgi:hypothetical protein